MKRCDCMNQFVLREVGSVASTRDWLDILTFFVAFITLILSSYFAYRSSKASERSAKSSETSSESSAKSASLASKSLEAQREYNEKSIAAQQEGLFVQRELSEKSFESAEKSLAVQREHNYKSVTPILRIWTPDHNEEVSVKFYNDGIGPLIITNVSVTNGIEETKDLISWMPRHPKGISYWTTFIGGFGETSISPGSFHSILLLENKDEDLPDYAAFRHEVRKHLSKLCLTVQCKDIYERPLRSQTISLEWFGRTIPKQELSEFTLTLTSAKLKFTAEEWESKVQSKTITQTDISDMPR